MKVIRNNTTNILIKATINNIIEKIFANNHKVILKTNSKSQTLPADNFQIVTIQSEPMAKAFVIKDGDL